MIKVKCSGHCFHSMLSKLSLRSSVMARKNTERETGKQEWTGIESLMQPSATSPTGISAATKDEALAAMRTQASLTYGTLAAVFYS